MSLFKTPDHTPDAAAAARQRMVEKQLRKRGIRDPRVLAAMNTVPREAFMPPDFHACAYDDGPLPIAHGQTISQPYVVAFMAECLQLTGSENVLEIGTGSGYGAAVLSRLGASVHTVERLAELADLARLTLAQLQYDNVVVQVGDGTLGWSDAAPYDAVCVTAGAEALPLAYLDQLASSGRIVIPLGHQQRSQTMHCFSRRAGRLVIEDLGSFAFVPLVGEHGWREDRQER